MPNITKSNLNADDTFRTDTSMLESKSVSRFIPPKDSRINTLNSVLIEHPIDPSSGAKLLLNIDEAINEEDDSPLKLGEGLFTKMKTAKFR